MRQWNTNSLAALTNGIRSSIEPWNIAELDRSFDEVASLRDHQLAAWIANSGRPDWLDFPGLTRSGDLRLDHALQLAEDLQTATRELTSVRGKAVVEFVSELSPGTIAERLRQLGEHVDAVAVVSVDHPYVSQAVDALRARHVPTFAILSDLTAEARAGFIGRDNRKEGRTAAWMIAKTARVPGKVGIIVGQLYNAMQMLR